MTDGMPDGAGERPGGHEPAGEADRRARLDDALARCAAGDWSGMEAVLALEGAQLLGVAIRMLGRRELAEEALHDALVQVWRGAGSRRHAGAGRGWLYAILRNRCRNVLRSERRLTPLPPADLAAMQDARQLALAEEGWRLLAGPGRLRDCLEELDGRGRQAILLAHVSGCTHGEIAARLDAPIGTVKSWIRRGLRTLRDCLS